MIFAPIASLESAVFELAEHQPLLRARDLTAHGLPTMLLTRLVAAGKLECVARDVYGLAGRAISEHRSLAEVALRITKGVVCLLSALHVHMSGSSLTEGVEPVQIEDVQVPVFNAAKTVADCFKYRNKIGLDVALEALRDGCCRASCQWRRCGTTPR